MKTPWLKTTLAGAAALITATLAFGAPPTPQQALTYATKVVWVRRVLQGNQIHSYVREVWRFAPSEGAPPPVGSEYGRPMPYDPRMRNPDRDGIIFAFGANRPKGMVLGWGIQVMEDGTVYPFGGETVDQIRADVRASTPKE